MKYFLNPSTFMAIISKEYMPSVPIKKQIANKLKAVPPTFTYDRMKNGMTKKKMKNDI